MGKKWPQGWYSLLQWVTRFLGRWCLLVKNVSNIEVGKKFVVYPWIGCGECEACKADNEHECGPFTAQNIGVAVDGGYGEYVLVKHSRYLFDAGDTPG